MAKATAGYKGEITADNDKVGGVRDADISLTKAELDEATDFDDTDVARITGLGDVELSLTVNPDGTDPGQSNLNFAFTNGDDITIKYLFDGSVGYEATYVVTEMNTSQAVDGVVERTYSCLLSDGSVTLV